MSKFCKIAIFVGMIIIYAFPSLATEMFSSNGYDVEALYYQEHRQLTVRGHVKNGKICRELNIVFSLFNEPEGKEGKIKARVRHYRPIGGSFRSSSNNHASNPNRHSWQMQDVEVTCVK
ncbi:MAG: hypothetical protein OCC45_05765 [Desulfotalea sp.]